MKATKTTIILLSFIFLFGCKKDVPEPSEEFQNKYIDLEGHFSTYEFEQIKQFIVNNGDKSTFSTAQFNSPHYSFEEFEAYLVAEKGSLWNDQAITDFGILYILDKVKYKTIFSVLRIKKGNLSNWENAPIGLEEEKVYLVNNENKDVETYMTNVLPYIEKLKAEVIQPLTDRP